MLNTYVSDPVLIGIVAAVGGIAGGAGLWSVVVKWMDRDIDDATARVTHATAEAAEHTVLREIIGELRIEKADATARITVLETRDREREERVQRLEKRMTEQEVKLEERDQKIAQLEDRERHALTRAAVHEAWDQMSFALLVTDHPQHPPPPPIRDPLELPERTSPLQDATRVRSEPTPDEGAGL